MKSFNQADRQPSLEGLLMDLVDGFGASNPNNIDFIVDFSEHSISVYEKLSANTNDKTAKNSD